MSTEILEIGYVNYRGEYSIRRIIPLSIKYGATPHHPEPQWLLEAFDMDKEAQRTFAMKDFSRVSELPPEPAKLDTNVKGDPNCNEARMQSGLAYPRTCKVCGFGPCHYPPMKVT